MFTFRTRTHEDPIFNKYSLFRGVINVPGQFNESKAIRGTYIFFQQRKERLRNTSWEHIAREFYEYSTSTRVEGRGSVKVACNYIQNHWTTFTQWFKNKYPKDIVL